MNNSSRHVDVSRPKDATLIKYRNARTLRSRGGRPAMGILRRPGGGGGRRQRGKEYRSEIVGYRGSNEETNHPTSLNFPIVGVVGMRARIRAMPFSRSFVSLHFFCRLFSVLSLPPVPPPPSLRRHKSLRKICQAEQNEAAAARGGRLRGSNKNDRAKSSAEGGAVVRGSLKGVRARRKMEPSTSHFLRSVRTDIRV